MKLTGRQKMFLSRFLDLYREAEEPLHYTVVAERLGVG
ncbi:MAG TPA: Lrp/AsnC family transcriptional regulator, partial [Anaerolineae bacterium]|nr:Lrp/AsnC family transcriptional regulator [Anaerolineae bacterium]